MRKFILAFILLTALILNMSAGAVTYVTNIYDNFTQTETETPTEITDELYRYEMEYTNLSGAEVRVNFYSFLNSGGLFERTDNIAKFSYSASVDSDILFYKDGEMFRVVEVREDMSECINLTDAYSLWLFADSDNKFLTVQAILFEADGAKFIFEEGSNRVYLYGKLIGEYNDEPMTVMLTPKETVTEYTPVYEQDFTKSGATTDGWDIVNMSITSEGLGINTADLGSNAWAVYDENLGDSYRVSGTIKYSGNFGDFFFNSDAKAQDNTFVINNGYMINQNKYHMTAQTMIDGYTGNTHGHYVFDNLREVENSIKEVDGKNVYFEIVYDKGIISYICRCDDGEINSFVYDLADFTNTTARHRNGKFALRECSYSYWIKNIKIEKKTESRKRAFEDIAYFAQTQTDAMGNYALDFKFVDDITKYKAVITTTDRTYEIPDAEIITDTSVPSASLDFHKEEKAVIAELTMNNTFIGQNDTCFIIIAFYNSDNILIDMHVGRNFSGYEKAEIPETAKRASAFVWERVDSATPYPFRLNIDLT